MCVVSLGGGCAGRDGPAAEPLAGAAGVNRRRQLWQINYPSPPATATQPADAPGGPHRLNPRTIIGLAYERSPLTTASREEMIAAQHGLAEFKANLSRFEPFVEATGDTSKYPERRESRGVSGEAVAGIEKETFDGAVFRLEGGLSGSRVEFGEVEEEQEAVEEGSGGLVRARVEVPFAGSQKRQSRVISAAFQESTARKAVLSYLSDYRAYVDQALEQYHYALYYMNYARAYERKIARLEQLLKDPRLKPEDRSRIEASSGDARVLADSYRSYYRTYLLSLLESLGIGPDEDYTLDDRDGTPSHYLEPSRTPDGKQALLAEAYENNPKFQVLEDAIGDSELKRAQAIESDFDVTAFLEGTQFAFGAETYDDRVGGWQVQAGVTVRMNDRRVLDASRKKAEAEIRQYRAQIEAERLRIRREIATQSDKLCSYYDSLPQILENMEKTETEFADRSRSYLNGESDILTIDDVLASLNAHIQAHTRLAANLFYTWLAETSLMLATGEVYRIAGLSLAEGGGVKLPTGE